MKIYVFRESVPYGEYVHVVRANGLRSAKKLIKDEIQDNGNIIETKSFMCKGKQKHLFIGGTQE